MATVFNRYGTVWIAATLMTAAGLWYARPNKGMVLGKDAAHVLAMADVRVQGAYLFGTNEPDLHVGGWVTNVVVTTNATATVVFDPAEVNDYTVYPSNVVFTSENWDVPQVVTFANPYGYWPQGVFYFSIDGIEAGYIVAQSSGYVTNGVYGGEHTYGDMRTEGNVVRVVDGTTQDMWIVMDAAPTENLVYTTNVIVVAVPDMGYRIDAVMRWAPLYSNTLCRVRDAACLDKYGRETARRIYWLAGDITNGQWIAEQEALSWTNVSAYEWAPVGWTNRTGVATTSWREPGANYLAGVSVTNYPVASDLFPGVVDKTGQGAFGSAFNWWGSIGMGTNAYAWGCELVTGSVVRAFNMQVTTNNLNQARHVMTNMTRTVCLLDPSTVEYTNRVYWVRTATDTNGMDFTYATAAAAIAPLESLTVGTNAGSQGVTGPGYRYCYGACSRSVWDGVPDPWVNRANYWVQNAKYFGCLADYPCEWACASGMVSRIRVYGLFDGNTPKSMGFDTRVYTNLVQDAYADTDGYDGDTLGVAYLDGHAKADPPLALQTNGVFQKAYGNPIAKLRAALIADVAEPRTRPRWDFGTEDALTPTNAALYTRVTWVRKTAFSNVYVEGNSWDYWQEVTLRKLLVVVDWSWGAL